MHHLVTQMLRSLVIKQAKYAFKTSGNKEDKYSRKHNKRIFIKSTEKILGLLFSCFV